MIGTRLDEFMTRSRQPLLWLRRSSLYPLSKPSGEVLMTERRHTSSFPTSPARQHQMILLHMLHELSHRLPSVLSGVLQLPCELPRCTPFEDQRHRLWRKPP